MTISMSSKQTLTICEHLSGKRSHWSSLIMGTHKWERFIMTLTRASIELTPSTHFLLFGFETAHLYNVLTHDHLTTVDRWWYSCVQVITAIVILGPLCTHGAARVHYTRQITWNTENTLYIYVLGVYSLLVCSYYIYGMIIRWSANRKFGTLTPSTVFN